MLQLHWTVHSSLGQETNLVYEHVSRDLGFLLSILYRRESTQYMPAIKGAATCI